MEQKVIRKEKEVEFVFINKKKYECSDCHKKFSHIQSCKDGKDRCKHCKKKMVTNIWYDPNWKLRQKNQFVGKYNLNSQERSILITEKIKKGSSVEQAKRQVNLDTKQLQNLRSRNYYSNLEKVANENMEKEKSKEMNKKLIEGLGLKK